MDQAERARRQDEELRRWVLLIWTTVLKTYRSC
jgi:hypothetical protein